MSVAYSGISIVNAIPCYKGAVMPINLRVYVKEGKKNVDSPLIRAIEDYLQKNYGLKTNFEIYSEIPEGVGLKSSSAVSVAMISAIREKIGDIYPPKLSAIITKMYNLSITGAFDDAVASYEGKISFTDNLNLKIIKLLKIEGDYKAIIFINDSRHELQLKLMRENCKFFEDAFEKALQGDIFNAMKINGLLMSKINNYDQKIIESMISKGALAAGISGNGPAYFAIVKNGDQGPIIDYLEGKGKILIVEVL